MTTYEAAKYNYTGENLTTIPTSAVTSGTWADARISESSVTQHASSYDDTKLKNDFATVAIRQAIDESLGDYVLGNTFIDNFEDDTGLDGQTNTDRNTNFEYMSAVTGSAPDAYTKLLIHSSTNDNNLRFEDDSPSKHTIYNHGATFHDTATAKFGGSSINFGVGANETKLLAIQDHADFRFGTDAFTIDYWMKSSDSNNRRVLSVPGSPSGNTGRGAGAETDQWFIRQDLQSTGHNINFGGSNIASSTTFSSTDTGDNSWHHIEWSKPSNASGNADFKCAVDGTFGTAATAPSGDNWSNQSNSFASGHPFRIGGISMTPFGMYGDFYAGYIDEFRVSKGVQRHGSNFTPSTVPYGHQVSATGNFTSVNQTANATISKGGILVIYEDWCGTATLNTDLVASISADGGSNYTTTTLVAAGTHQAGYFPSYDLLHTGHKTGLPTLLMAAAQNVTIGTTGTSMKYKIAFANQALASKITRVYGVVLLY